MKLSIIPILLLFFWLLINPFCAPSQEENTTVVKQGTRYLNLKTKSINKCNSRVEHQQDHLLKKLKKKETHLAHKLKKTDSLAYARYQQQSSPSYDSIGKLSRNDTSDVANNISIRKNETVDSLRGVQSFVQSKSEQSGNIPSVEENNTDLSKLQKKLNYRNYINELITKRTDELKTLSGSKPIVPGLTGIEKQAFYGKSKMNAFKEIEEEPTKAEDKAMEYLQGSKGFDESMNNATQGGSGSMQALGAAGANAAQLEQMGYQTKRQVQANLSQKFGGNLGLVSEQMSSQISQWQDKQKDLTDVKQTKQSLQELRETGKPTFKVNPMRGLPFWKRIEKQYSFQATRTSDNQPATIEPSATVGFKHTPKLMYGIGVACSIGLGQNWQNIHFSFRGIGLRSFATWQWQYGISAYAGYERMYKLFEFKQQGHQANTDIIPTPHNTANYNESILIGLTKSYNLHSKYNGAIQVLYDIWWQQKGLTSPIVLRFVTTTK